MSKAGAPKASETVSSSVQQRNYTVEELIEQLMNDTYDDAALSTPGRILTENEITAFTIFTRAARGAVMEARNRDDNNNSDIAGDNN